jgi:formylglycine-generating enzyme required for sulfatase activity
MFMVADTHSGVADSATWPREAGLEPDNTATAERLLTADAAEVKAEGGSHSADRDQDCRVNLTELLRVIQFFNIRGLRCATPPINTEDGYVPGSGTDTSCARHDSDYLDPAWVINLTELLRLIQFFNMGGYTCAPGAGGSEDGFLPGVSPAGCLCGPLEYTLTYIAGVNGAVMGDTPQTVEHGGMGTPVEAVADPNYHFVQWSDGSTVNPRTDMDVTANINVTAQFAKDSYTLTYTAGEHGTLVGDSSQAVDHGGSGSAIEAVPDPNYHFVQWSDGSTVNPRTDMGVTANINVTAQFAKYSYTLTYTAGEHGTLVGDSPQAVEHGGDGTAVEAVPDPNYHFVQWSDGKTDNPRTDEDVTADVNVAAEFTIVEYTLTYTAGEHGAVMGDSPQIVAHGGDGSAVEAVPDTCYHFTQWSDGRTDNPRSDEGVTADSNVTAEFDIDSFTLIYTADENGSVLGDSPQSVSCGGSGSAVEAVPDPNYHFVQWSDGKTDNPRADEDVTADVNVTAEFMIDTFTLTYAAGEHGTVVGDSPQTVDHGGDGSAVEAVPDLNYHFVQWSDGKTDNPRTDEDVTADLSVTAEFALVDYTLTYTAGEHGTVVGDTPQTVAHGGNGTPVEAAPDSNYHFVQWSDGKTDNPRTDEDVTADLSVTAEFALVDYALTYTAGEHGTVVGDSPQIVTHGGDGTAVEAVPDTCCHFTQWSDGRTDNPRTDEGVTADSNVTAEFAIDSFTLIYTADENGAVLGDSPQSVSCGGSGSAVEAVPDSNYHFVQWSDGKTDNPRTDEDVTANVNVTAEFAVDTYTLTYAAGEHGSLVGDSPQTVGHGGASRAVEALPDLNYHFVKWSDGRTDNPRTDENVTADINVTAEFAIDAHTLTYAAGEHGTLVGDNPQTVDHGGTGRAVEAVPEECYHFVQWSDARTDNPRTDENVMSDISAAAEFAINIHTLTYTADENGSVLGESPQTVDCGGSGSAVEAVPDLDYLFVQWSDGRTDNPRTDENVSSDVDVSAIFGVEPVITSFLINDGDDSTSNPVVALNNVCLLDPTDYMASEDSDFSGASWLPYDTAPSFSLSAALGTATVYFKVRNAAGESQVASDSIQLVPEMVQVPSGTFTMGRRTDGADASGGADELPQHEVTLSAYSIGKFEVTNQQYCDVLNWAIDPSRNYLLDSAGEVWAGIGDIYAGNYRQIILSFSSADFNIQFVDGMFTPRTRIGLPGTTDYSTASHAVVMVSWYGSVAFCNWLSEMEGLTPCYTMSGENWPLATAPPVSGGYRLPTEAEWERAAAWDAEASKHWIFGMKSDTLTGASRCNYNPAPHVNPLGLTGFPYTSPAGWFDGANVSPNGSVATLDSPSPAGCYDMSGNAFEWCHDWYLGTYYGGGAMSDPTGPASGTARVVRGGGWGANSGACRTAYRYSYTPSSPYYFGFRLARS